MGKNGERRSQTLEGMEGQRTQGVMCSRQIKGSERRGTQRKNEVGAGSDIDAQTRLGDKWKIHHTENLMIGR